jgi:hypothetical protein
VQCLNCVLRVEIERFRIRFLLKLQNLEASFCSLDLETRSTAT